MGAGRGVGGMVRRDVDGGYKGILIPCVQLSINQGNDIHRQALLYEHASALDCFQQKIN